MKVTGTLTIIAAICVANADGFAIAGDKKNLRLLSTSLQMEVNLPMSIAAIAAASAGIAYIAGSEGREKKNQYAEYEARSKAIAEERKRKAFIEPKDYWEEEELKQYDGSQDPDGPILMAADGIVFNVYKGRHFYGPGCEYHVFAGRNATRLLAKSKLEEETEEEKAQKLNMAERATLKGWLWTFDGKYEVVGKLKGFDEESTSTRTVM
jgi:membrane-associated progesterone receptor component|eukprot:scaffold2640_cov256-Chaetoceros_neogracile.AAC.9